MLQISPQHTTEDTLNTLLDKAESICLLKKLLNMFLHNLFVNSYNNEERIVMEFSSFFVLWSGSIMFSIIYRVCRSVVLDKKRLLYILYMRYMTRRRVYVSHRELDIC